MTPATVLVAVATTTGVLGTLLGVLIGRMLWADRCNHPPQAERGTVYLSRRSR